MIDKTISHYKIKAIEHYDKFHDLWKDTDRGISEITKLRGGWLPSKNYLKP